MQFPNALEGVKKIYKAEILELIAGIVGLVAALLMVIGAAGMEADSDVAAVGGILGGGVLLIAVAVLSIISFIMSIVGVKKAMPDEENFKNAFYVLIVGIVAGIVIGCAKAGGILSDTGETVSSICSFLAQYYIITAIIVLAQRLGDGEMETKGTKTRSMLMVVWVIRIIFQVIDIFVGKNATVDTASAILALLAAIVGIIAYFMYLGLLKKARVMLEQ